MCTGRTTWGGNTPTLGEFLEQYDCVHIHPVKLGEPCWVYDPATGLITLHPNLSDEVGGGGGEISPKF